MSENRKRSLFDADIYDARPAIKEMASLLGPWKTPDDIRVQSGDMRKNGFGDFLTDVAGKVWTSPNTALGLTLGLAGTGLGLLTGSKPRITLGHNAVQFFNNPLMPGGAIALGNAVNYAVGRSPDGYAYDNPRANLGKHEEAHTYQSQLYGPFFLPRYFFGGPIADVEKNDLERSAQGYALGEGDWRPYRRQGKP